MFKKLLVTIGAGGLLLGLFFGRDACSYVSTTATRVKQSVRNAVPAEFEIARAREMLKNLTPEIRQNMETIAREEVELERLSKEVEKMDRQHKKERSDMKTLHADLKSGDQVFHYGSRDYTIHQVKMDLANRLARCQTRGGTLKQMRQVYEARLRGLNSSRQQLEQMLATRRQLEVDLENIDAHRKMVEVAKTASHLSLDDSRLSRIKDLLADLNTRLEVDSRLANADNHFQEEIPVSSPQAENIEDQVAAYFQEETTPDQAYVVSD